MKRECFFFFFLKKKKTPNPNNHKTDPSDGFRSQVLEAKKEVNHLDFVAPFGPLQIVGMVHRVHVELKCV